MPLFLADSAAAYASSASSARGCMALMGPQLLLSKHCRVVMCVHTLLSRYVTTHCSRSGCWEFCHAAANWQPQARALVLSAITVSRYSRVGQVPGNQASQSNPKGRLNWVSQVALGTPSALCSGVGTWSTLRGGWRQVRRPAVKPQGPPALWC